MWRRRRIWPNDEEKVRAGESWYTINRLEFN
jgi:hypothetical protein